MANFDFVHVNFFHDDYATFDFANDNFVKFGIANFDFVKVDVANVDLAHVDLLMLIFLMIISKGILFHKPSICPVTVKIFKLLFAIVSINL